MDNLGHTSPVGREVLDSAASTSETPDFIPFTPETPNSFLPTSEPHPRAVGAAALDLSPQSTLEQPSTSEQAPTIERPSTPERPQVQPNQPQEITNVVPTPNNPVPNSISMQPSPNPITPPTPNNTEITNTANYLGREAKNKANFGETAKAALLEGIDKDPLTFYSNFQKLRNKVQLGNKNVQNPTLYGGNS